MDGRIQLLGLVLAIVVATVTLGTVANAAGGAEYTPPGGVAPVVVTGTPAPEAARPGVPTARETSSVRGNYPGTTAGEIYCIVFGRSC
jgi:hypothetical protein